MSDTKSGYQKFFQEARRNADGEKPMTPEQQVLRHLSAKAGAKRKQTLRRRRPPPTFAILLLVVSVIAGGLGVIAPNALDSVKEFESALSSFGLPTNLSSLPHIRLGIFGHANAKSDTVPAAKSVDAPAETAVQKTPVEGTSTVATAKESNPDVKSWSSEEMSFFKKLNDRKLELDRRELELSKLEEELQKQRAGIEDKIKQLEKTRAEISETLKGRVEQDQEKVAKLVDVYSSMKPTSASKVIETLNEDLAVTILDKMKKKNAAEILNTMSAPKARRLSEMLTGYRQPASTGKSEE